MMVTATCLPRETLKRYLSGTIADDQSGQIEEHLSVCPACEQTVLQLESDPDTLLDSVRELGVAESQVKSAVRDSPSVVQRAIAAARVLAQPPMVPATPLQKPAQIGAYELLQSLGRGGMGQVFLARHTSLDKQVAVKLLFPRPGHSGLDAEQLISRFQREMRAAGRLNHPTIVSATDAGQDNGTHYLVMEYIDGIDLSRLAKATGPLSIANACELIRLVAQGLSHAHAAGIVHRDIKPSNLMLDRQGRVKILDFGLAQWNLLNESANELTTVGQLMGTLDYMAPEQAERNDGVDYRADLYALGATLFRLLTGRPPLAASPSMTLLEKVRLLGSQSAPALSSLRSDAPPALVQLVASLLQRQITERPASAAHVAAALEPFCAGHDLTGLFANAETLIEQPGAPEHDQQSSNPLAQSPAAHPAPEFPPIPPSRMGKWLWAAAALPLLILAGVLVTLELQKGQLVIQSDVADIHVQLRRDNQTVKELTIQPGTTTTRLSADQYEIVIDAPSDQVSIDKESFTVRNGQTIVATVKQVTRDEQPSAGPPAAMTLEDTMQAALSATNPEIVAAPETNGNPTQPTVSGLTFPQWLSIVQRSTDAKDQLMALSAIEKLVDQVANGQAPAVDMPSAIPIIEKSLQSEAAKARDKADLYKFVQLPNVNVAFNVLSRLGGLPEFIYVQQQLAGNNVPWRRMILVRETTTALLSRRLDMGVASYAIDIVTGTKQEDPELVEAAADYLMVFAGRPLYRQMPRPSEPSNPKSPFRRDPLEILDTSPKITNEYWFTQLVARLTTNGIAVIERRARETLLNQESPPQLVVLAALVLQDAVVPDIQPAIRTRLAQLLLEKPRLMTTYVVKTTSVELTIAKGSELNLKSPSFMVPDCEFKLLLNLISNEAESTELLKQAIDQLHKMSGHESRAITVELTQRPLGSLRGRLSDFRATLLRAAGENVSIPQNELLLGSLAACAQFRLNQLKQTPATETTPKIADANADSVKPVNEPAQVTVADDKQESTSTSNVDDWLNMLEKATTYQDRVKCLNSLVSSIDETFGPAATPKLLAAARTWDYENAPSTTILGRLRGSDAKEDSQPSAETLLLYCLSRCNSLDRYLQTLCTELLSGEDRWTARWMAGLAQYNQRGSYTAGMYGPEILERMLSQEFAAGPLSKFGPDTALLWQEYLRRELSANRRWAQIYSRVAVKRILEQSHLGPVSLMKLDPSSDLRWFSNPSSYSGRLVLEEAIAGYAKQVLVDPNASPELSTRAAFRLATTGPFVERWREELVPIIRTHLQRLLKQADDKLFERLPDESTRILEWQTNEMPASYDVFHSQEDLPASLRGLRYVNSQALSYLALIKRLELEREVDAELKELLERCIVGREPLRQIASKKHEWIARASWSSNRSFLVAPWNEAPESAWNSHHIYNAITVLLNDTIVPDSAAQQLKTRDETRFRMELADLDGDGRLSKTEIENYSGRVHPDDPNNDGMWDFEELLADQLKNLKRLAADGT